MIYRKVLDIIKFAYSIFLWKLNNMTCNTEIIGGIEKENNNKNGV